jgi:hypothetical protein
MPGADGSPPSDPPSGSSNVADEIVRSAPQDLVFVMRFLGESRYRLMRHFQGFIRAELTRRDAALAEHPLLTPFIDRHAGELRDFVFGGVSLSRQFRLGEIESLMGDSTSLMRLDIWDSLKSHIETAERSFLAQVDDLPTLIAVLDDDRDLPPRRG